MIDFIPLQDRDLLSRLSQYFDAFQANLAEGRGWLILNANSRRSSRIVSFVVDQLRQLHPFVSYYLMPWRDFALNAYMSKIELSNKNAPIQETTNETTQRQIASRVTVDSYYQMLHTDMLVISGVAPHYRHETDQLVEVFSTRRQRRLATILISPRGLEELREDFVQTEGGSAGWDQLFAQIYETCLIAL